MSIFSYESRGHWGSSKWRGNCSGYFYQDIFTQLQPSSFIDPMVGSGTSIEVAQEMGVESFGLDLHSGFNVLRDSILQEVGKPVDLCFSHPPYGAMIKYSGSVWGMEPHADDLSHSKSVDDFYEKMIVTLINQRESVKAGGYYGTLIADHRVNGEYISYQAELISRMPTKELKAVLIKAQHNTMSSRKSYSNMKLPFITHEYGILWQKPDKTVLLLPVMAKQAYERVKSSWRVIVRAAMVSLGGTATLKELYTKVFSMVPERTEVNSNWEAKIRQILQKTDCFSSEKRGVWSLSI